MDSRRYRIHKVDSTGNLQMSLGRQGRGTGEFMKISGYTRMATESNRLYVTDLAGMTNPFLCRMHLFSLDYLSFIKTIDLLADDRSDLMK